jgi:adenylosuccinate synthase
MAAKKKAAKAGAGAFAAGKAVRSNPYVQRLVDDDELRDNLRSAFESARKAYTRMSNGKGPVKAVTEDKKVQRELRDAATSLKDAADSLRGAKKKKKRRKGRLLLVALIGGAVALAASEGLRKKVLDALFGAEEEFEYTGSTTPEPSSTSEPVGTA